ncbi:MAG: PTS mannose transporter subunit IIA [Aerococcus sp.]|nr:PTS mannose transporter subunit IIA [Aerococcus sp.]
MTTKYLVASHGHLAEGLQSAIHILANMDDQLHVINAYIDDTDFMPEVDEFLGSLTEEDQMIIFTDLMGGSVNQKIFQAVMTQQKQNQAFIITNTNLPILLSILLEDREWDGDSLKQAVSDAQVQCLDLGQL